MILMFFLIKWSRYFKIKAQALIADRTCVARVASPAWQTGAAESVTVVVAGPSIAAGGGVTLTLTWRDYSDTLQSHTQTHACDPEDPSPHRREKLTRTSVT